MSHFKFEVDDVSEQDWKAVMAIRKFISEIKQPITNADRIRAMSDAELEDFIRNIAIYWEPWCDHHCNMNGDDNCNSCLAKWLKKPAEEGDGNG